MYICETFLFLLVDEMDIVDTVLGFGPNLTEFRPFRLGPR
jgi:hypothetical protein